MHPMVYVVLLVVLAGAARAHFRGFDARNLVERDDLDTDIYETKIVSCPVCESQSRARDWQSYSEACPINVEGKLYKMCRFGTYINEKCGGRLDCYRGEGEPCTEKHLEDRYGLRCGPGLYCHPKSGLCQGSFTRVPSDVQRFINPISFPLRQRRQA